MDENLPDYDGNFLWTSAFKKRKLTKEEFDYLMETLIMARVMARMARSCRS